jgi:hypothetical protein
MAPNPPSQSTHKLIPQQDVLGQFAGWQNPLTNPPVDSLDSDEPPLESDLHRELIELLLSCLHPTKTLTIPVVG